MPRNSLFLLLLQKADQDRYILDKLVGDDAAPDDKCDDADKALIRNQVTELHAWVLEHAKECGSSANG